MNNAVVTVPTYSMVPSVRPPGRRKYLKTRRAVIIDEAHSSCLHMAWTSGQLGGSVLDYDMGTLPSTCLQTIEDDIFDASPWSKNLNDNSRTRPSTPMKR